MIPIECHPINLTNSILSSLPPPHPTALEVSVGSRVLHPVIKLCIFIAHGRTLQNRHSCILATGEVSLALRRKEPVNCFADFWFSYV